MYKIYINETPLYLTNEESARVSGKNDEKNLVLRYPGKKRFLVNVVHQLESSQRFEGITVYSPEPEEMWKTFQKIFTLIEAAGGVVFNEREEFLMIYRRGFWDLPKGKIDPGETPEVAALREVWEETGLQNVTLGTHLTDTWHTYEQKGKRILKRTYWFLMSTADTDLRLQHEEDIEKAAWLTPEEFGKNPPGTAYSSIKNVLNKINPGDFFPKT